MAHESEDRKRRILAAIADCGGRVSDALHAAGLSGDTFYTWRKRDKAFDTAVRNVIRESKQEAKALADSDLVYEPNRKRPAPMPLEEGRLTYIGRPTPTHQKPVIRAWEDRTNLAVVLLGPPGPQPRWASVDTPAGPRTIGELVPGDEVFGPDGQPTRVIRVEPAGRLHVWALHLAGGPTVYAADRHRWPAHGKRGPRPSETAWLAARCKGADGRSPYWLSPPDALYYPAADLPLDPYVLGVLLGDGTFRQNTVKFTTVDGELVERVRRRLPAGVSLHNYSGDIHWRLVGSVRDRHRFGGKRGIVRQILNDLGLADLGAQEKFIPAAYMHGSVEQRLALLRGLMDTDGSVGTKAGATFTTTSPQLRDQLTELVRSLGGMAWVGHQSDRAGRRTDWTVRVQIRETPFLIERKRSRYRCRRHLRYLIRSATDMGTEQCVCIRVAADHHQYLTHGIPTCNSGKDTLAGDIVLLESAFYPTRRHAWLMESAEFSIRRMEQRVAPYLQDYRAYDRAPQGPGCVQPKRNLIDDYGPFRWKAGMVYPDGERVPQPTWTKHALYFLGRDQEADPNVWASGIGGATYGARIDTGVTSDIFTPDNQGSPVVQADQLGWLFNTFFSRLDEGGRYLHLGTMIGPNDNQQAVLKHLIGEAEPVEQDGYYTKYGNGVATIIYPAIQQNEAGEEVSYWPERFPLRSKLVLPDGTEVLADDLTADRQRKLAAEGARRLRGLHEIRERDRASFEIMYQQNPPSDSGGEISRELLDHCDDPSRSIGAPLPGRPLVLGIDPARSGGAGWVLWEFNPEDRSLTVIDFFYGEKLGLAGLREKLLVQPIGRWWPRYVAYEYNFEASALEHPDVISAVDRTRTEVVRHFTAMNRIQGETRVAAMTFDLRDRRIRFPAATQQDRNRMAVLKQQALNWDARSVGEGRPVASRRGGPDHLWMAAWVGWVTVKQRLDKPDTAMRVGRRVPEITRRRWGGPQAVLPPQAKPTVDLVAQWYA